MPPEGVQMYLERLPCVRLESPAAWAGNRDPDRVELTLAVGGVHSRTPSGREPLLPGARFRAAIPGSLQAPL